MESNRIFFKSNLKNPEIKFSGDHLSISGNSIDFNPESIYTPLTNWLSTYTGEVLKVEINLHILNCSSIKLLLQAMVAADLNENIKKKSITWFFKDQEEQELGDMIASNLKNTRFKLYCKN